MSLWATLRTAIVGTLIGSLSATTHAGSNAAKFTVLHHFNGTNGQAPQSTLVIDDSGTLFGVTQSGGTNGTGVVFALFPPAAGQTAWTERVLYNFTGGVDGGHPYGSLTSDGAGGFYGTTAAGGDQQCILDTVNGCGVVFHLTPPVAGKSSWKQTVLYAFKGGANDGARPRYLKLLVDKSGSIYGTASLGGDLTCDPLGCGGVFKLTPPATGKTAWTEQILRMFRGGNDGMFPWTGLIADDFGNLWGTTGWGGVHQAGIIFELEPPISGEGRWTEKIIHAFKGGTGNPVSALVAGADGSFYGTTFDGGTSGSGTAFQLGPQSDSPAPRTFRILHSFSQNMSGGFFPLAELILDKSGNLYGATEDGGGLEDTNAKKGAGVIFKLLSPSLSQPGWTKQVLHSFSILRPNNGEAPLGGLVSLDGQTFYGTTILGGSPGGSGDGVVFKLDQ